MLSPRKGEKERLRGGRSGQTVTVKAHSEALLLKLPKLRFFPQTSDGDVKGKRVSRVFRLNPASSLLEEAATGDQR